MCLPQNTVLEAGKPTPILVVLLICPSDPKEDDGCRCSYASCPALRPPGQGCPAELGMSVPLTRPEAMQGTRLLGHPLVLLGASPLLRQVKDTALTAVAEREVKETHSGQTD